jgi:hypothetical protein
METVTLGRLRIYSSRQCDRMQRPTLRNRHLRRGAWRAAAVRLKQHQLR